MTMHRATDGGVQAAQRQTARFHREAVRGAARGRRWQTPEQIAKATGLQLAVVAWALGYLLRRSGIEARGDGHYRVPPTGGSR